MSIYENICYGDVTRKDIPINEIIEVCKESNIQSRIENLPDV
jgi:ABC-type multidrug transport system fused ATPase/permease subunit